MTGSRWAAVAFVALLLGVSAPTTAAGEGTVALGMNHGSARELRDAGAPPAYSSYWVGIWTAQYGWGGLENMLRDAAATGTTPVVYWYYWGDSITPACVENGCDGRTKAQWVEMTATLREKIGTIMAGRETIVVLENEFNKGGITDPAYAPTFDAYLAARADELKQAPGVKIVLGYGSWGEDAWGRFPKAIAASDMIGFQIMRGSTRDTEATYRGAAQKVADVLAHIRSLSPGKHAFLYDVALSSYPEPYWREVQASTLESMLNRRAEYAQGGLVGLVYRELRDNPSMGTWNYFGVAEQYWGLWEQGGTRKPAWDVWLAAHGATQPTTGVPNVPGAFEGEAMGPTTGGRQSDSTASGGAVWNLWSNGELRQQLFAEEGGEFLVTATARGTSADGVDARMELRLNGTTFATFDVAAGALREHAASVRLPAGGSTLTIVFTNDVLTATEDRNLLVDVVRIEAQQPNAAPVASFAASAHELNVSLDASASSDADGDALTYAWTFGDGATASGAFANHTYAAAGDYVVTLVVSDGKANATARQAVTVSQANAAPTASFTASGADLSWTFDANASSDADGDALTYAWSFGDGTNATGVNVTKTFAAAGNHTVTLVVSDGRANATATATVAAVAPNRAPVASFTSAGKNLSWSFDASESADADGDALAYAWTFGDGTTATGLRVSKTYAAAGNYTVTLDVSDGSANATATSSVIATQPNRAPVASFTTSGGNLSWTFDASNSTDADGDALTYAWSFGDGTNATGRNVTKTFAAAGNYTVTLRVSDGSLHATATSTIVATQPNRAPVASFTAAGKDLSWTFDASNSTDADGDALTYAWTFGDGTKATGRNVTKTYAAPGNYTVTLRVSDGSLNATATSTVTAAQPNRAPTATFAASGGDLSWTFDASNSTDADGDALTYAWTFGDGTNATGRAVQKAYAAAGNYTVRLVVSDGKANAVASRTVTATQPNRAPVAAFVVTGKDLAFTFDASGSTDADGDALRYRWEFGDGTFADSQVATKTYAKAGNYSVRLSVLDPAGAAGEETRLVRATEPAPAPALPAFRSLQAEAFARKDNGAAFADASASNGSAWLLWSNGAVAQTFRPGNGTFRVEIVAKGDHADGWPLMELRADGQPVARWTVSSSTWMAYAADVAFAPGQTRTLSVHFLNDHLTTTGDRNLRVDVVRAWPPGMRYEGEAFGTKSVGGLYADPTASAGKAWLLWSNGAIAQELPSDGGMWTVEIVAKGDYARGWPVMELRMDGSPVARWNVASATWQTYRADVVLPADRATALSIHFLNDHYDRKRSEDRNLYVDRVDLVPTLP